MSPAKKDQVPPPEEEKPRGGWRWLIILSRLLSGLIFVAGFVWSAQHFTSGELLTSIILMLFPMAMIWYPKEIDDYVKGGYGEGEGSLIIMAAFGWVCLFVYLSIIGLRVEGYL